MEPEPAFDPVSVSGSTWSPPDSLRDLAQRGFANLVSEILDDFRTDVAARLVKLRQAVIARDITIARNEVHSIKGSAAQMGADALAEACRVLEVEAASAGWTLGDSQVEKIEGLFGRVAEEIERHPFSRRTGAAERT